MIGETVIFIEPFDGEWYRGRIISEVFPGWFAIAFPMWVGVVPRSRFEFI